MIIMIRLVAGIFLLIIVFAGLEYVAMTKVDPVIITVSEKYTDGDICVIKTISIQQFGVNCGVYSKMEKGKTYSVKIVNNVIMEARLV